MSISDLADQSSGDIAQLQQRLQAQANEWRRILDHTGIVCEVNQTAVGWLQHPADQLIGLPWARPLRDGPIELQTADRAALFERFYRGEVGRRSGAAGTELGLAICHDIALKLNGHITVDSRPGQGAVFTVWLRPVEVT